MEVGLFAARWLTMYWPPGRLFLEPGNTRKGTEKANRERGENCERGLIRGLTPPGSPVDLLEADG